MRKDQGGALGLALIILFLGSSAILLLTQMEGTRRIILIRENQSIVAMINLDSQRLALQDILNKNDSFPEFFGLAVENSWNDFPVSSHLYPFGHFVLFHSLCQTGKKEHKETGLLANMDFFIGSLRANNGESVRKNKFEYSLVQLDPEKSFVISGDTHLRGNLLISPRGIIAGTLHRLPYRLPIPINGRADVFREKLVMNSDPVKQTQIFLQGNQFPTAEIEVDKKGRLKLNFESVMSSSILNEVVRVIVGPGVIILDEPLSKRELPLVLRDFIWIYSPDSIVITENINSAYCLFLAEKKILIKGGTHQSQWLAPVIESRADTLFFPTVVSSLPGKHAFTIINSVVQGGIFQYSYNSEEREKSNQLFLNKRIEVSGVVWSENSMSPEAKIRGTLFLGRTYFYQSPTNYFNWLTDIQLRPGKEYRLFPYRSNGKNSAGVLYSIK